MHECPQTQDERTIGTLKRDKQSLALQLRLWQEQEAAVRAMFARLAGAVGELLEALEGNDAACAAKAKRVRELIGNWKGQGSNDRHG